VSNENPKKKIQTVLLPLLRALQENADRQTARSKESRGIGSFPEDDPDFADGFMFGARTALFAAQHVAELMEANPDNAANGSIIFNIAAIVQRAERKVYSEYKGSRPIKRSPAH